VAIRTSIHEFLYGPVREYYQRELHELIDLNEQISQGVNEIFVYRGIRYAKKEFRHLPKHIPRLDPTLHDRMERYLAETKELNDVEVPLVMGYIQNVLNTSDQLQDYLALFPSAIHPPIQQVIDHCNCRGVNLTLAEAEKMIDTHAKSFDYIKQRMVFNLLNKR
jgi:hypothetical protein